MRKNIGLNFGLNNTDSGPFQDRPTSPQVWPQTHVSNFSLARGPRVQDKDLETRF